jgi:TatA/E family protein of Tat protein translocase
MGPLGWQETIFIFILALLIFGPKKLPELGKTIGKAMTEFRRASSELKSTWDREMASLERENESLRDVATKYNNEIQSSVSDTYNYDSNSYYDSGYEYGYGAEPTSPATDSSTVGAAASSGAELTAGEQLTASAEAGGAETTPANPAVEAGADSVPPSSSGESKPVQA